jgi:hypothetical protein
MRLAAASLTILILFIAGSSTGARTAFEFENVPFKGSHDSFYNWDFTSRAAANSAHESDIGTDIDWPMNLLFYGNATIDSVKGAYELVGFDQEGTTMYGRMNDGSGREVDPDKGRKEHFCPGLFSPDEGIHFRIYAPRPPDHMTAGRRTLRAYVLGTSHIDKRECSLDGKQHGWSEDAEREIARRIKYVFGARAVERNYADWKNDELDHMDGRYFIQTNGKGTRVRIPCNCPPSGGLAT